MSINEFVIESVRNPRAVARRLIAYDPDVKLRWQGLLLLTILSTILPLAAMYLAGGETRAETQAANPVTIAIVQFAINVFTVLLITGVGQMAGGKGQFRDALLLLVWIQSILLIVQVAQCLAIVLLPVLMVPIAAAGVVLLLWMMAQSITELHGFQSPLRVFFAMIGMMFLVGLALTPFAAPFLTPAA
jgi:Yip1 domain